MARTLEDGTRVKTGGKTAGRDRGLEMRPMIDVPGTGISLPLMTTARELGPIVGKTANGLTTMAAAGDIPARKVGSRWMFPTLRCLQWAGLVA